MPKNISINRSNGNATYVTVGSKTWYFSYDTCVAFEELGTDQLYPVDQKATGLAHARRIRRDQNYSVTTAKHMGQMGVKDWPKVDDETFDRLAGAS